jgi:hypothetical protein
VASNTTLSTLLVATLRDLAVVRQDCEDYRELAQQAIHVLAELTLRHNRQAKRYHALLAGRRAQREQHAA